jgi:hypothetical protein
LNNNGGTGVNDEDEETIEEDPEFEEDLKQFQMRLMLCNQNSIASNG